MHNQQVRSGMNVRRECIHSNWTFVLIYHPFYQCISIVIQSEIVTHFAIINRFAFDVNVRVRAH